MVWEDGLMGSVLFVHGTGVREEGYRATVQRITRGLQAVVPGAQVQPCLWGPEVGATLARDGRSIPDFEGVTPLEAGPEARRLLWELLGMDATYELRELAARPSTGAGRVDAAVDDWPSMVAALSTDATVLALLPPEVPHKLWQQAVATVVAAPGLVGAARAARRVDTGVREAAARACVAGLLAALREIEAPPLSDDERDTLVRRVVDQLGGREAGAVFDWIGDKLKGAASRWATTKLVRQRDVLSNATYPSAGDILRYQARGAPLRRFIADRIEECPGEEVTVIAHSLGGIACVDLLAMASQPKVKQLVTVGSQAPLLYELGALRALKPGQHLPEDFPRRWVNVYDRHDLLSYLAAPVFGGQAARTILDMEVKSGQPFPDAHSAYWSTKDFWPALLERLLPL
jgi:hypothetical protein